MKEQTNWKNVQVRISSITKDNINMLGLVPADPPMLIVLLNIVKVADCLDIMMSQGGPDA